MAKNSLEDQQSPWSLLSRYPRSWPSDRLLLTLLSEAVGVSRPRQTGGSGLPRGANMTFFSLLLLDAPPKATTGYPTARSQCGDRHDCTPSAAPDTAWGRDGNYRGGTAEKETPMEELPWRIFRSTFGFPRSRPCVVQPPLAFLPVFWRTLTCCGEIVREKLGFLQIIFLAWANFLWRRGDDVPWTPPLEN
jgi:hypothetical protein